MVFGNYLSGPLGTTLSNAPGMVYGTQVGLSLAPELSLVGNIGYTTSDMKVGIPFLGGVSVGHSSMLIYDAGLEYNLGATTRRLVADSRRSSRRASARCSTTSSSRSSTHTRRTSPGNIGVGADYTIEQRDGAALPGEGLHRQVQLPGRDRSRHLRQHGAQRGVHRGAAIRLLSWLGGRGRAENTGASRNRDAPVSHFGAPTELVFAARFSAQLRWRRQKQKPNRKRAARIRRALRRMERDPRSGARAIAAGARRAGERVDGAAPVGDSWTRRASPSSDIPKGTRDHRVRRRARSATPRPTAGTTTRRCGEHHTFLFILSSRTCVDAAFDGNEARFINHSCEPNCETVIWRSRIWI